MIRKDYADVIYRTEKEKFDAIVEEIKECYERGQPVLVGTISIEKSERLAGYLKRHGVKHNVFNAKYHEKEAEDHRAGRSKGRRDDRDQHGGSRHRHSARRQSGLLVQASSLSRRDPA